MNTSINLIFVTGGVYSGIGKGILSSSIAKLLWDVEIRCTYMKQDGYLNVDAGTMNPNEHGEVFVTCEGGETDLDLGSVERYTGIRLTAQNSMTGGKINKLMLDKERRGDFLGKTVRPIPHTTNLIKDWIRNVATSEINRNGVSVKPQVCIIEIGGSIGDKENALYFEAARQLDLDPQFKCMFIHVAPVALINGEQKTRAAYESAQELRSMVRSPDIFVARCKEQLVARSRSNIALMVGINEDNILESTDVTSIHRVPLMLKKQGIVELIMNKFTFQEPWVKTPSTKNPAIYDKLLTYIDNIDAKNVKTVTIAMVGKYTHEDAYLSVKRALFHAGFYHNVEVNIRFVDARDARDHSDIERLINGIITCDAVIVPGGFGYDGCENIIKVISWCRQQNVPLLGICLGMQLMVIEHARNVSNINPAWAQSREWVEHPGPNDKFIIDILEGQDLELLGGTMRKGEYKSRVIIGLSASRLLAEICDSELCITERHRHRYELNNQFRDHLMEHGLRISAVHDNPKLVEIVEIPNNKKFYIGCQFHPEFNTYYWRPHPLFKGLVGAALMNQDDDASEEHD